MLTRAIQDPKLELALDEINAVLKKHAIAGAVCVASSTHAAFRLSFPEWSCIQLEGEGVRFARGRVDLRRYRWASTPRPAGVRRFRPELLT